MSSSRGVTKVVDGSFVEGVHIYVCMDRESQERVMKSPSLEGLFYCQSLHIWFRLIQKDGLLYEQWWYPSMARPNLVTPSLGTPGVNVRLLEWCMISHDSLIILCIELEVEEMQGALRCCRQLVSSVEDFHKSTTSWRLTAPTRKEGWQVRNGEGDWFEEGEHERTKEGTWSSRNPRLRARTRGVCIYRAPETKLDASAKKVGVSVEKKTRKSPGASGDIYGDLWGITARWQELA